MASHEQDLLPDQTEGFKVGEKKTMDEYNKLGTLTPPRFVCSLLPRLYFFAIFIACLLCQAKDLDWSLFQYGMSPPVIDSQNHPLYPAMWLLFSVSCGYHAFISRFT